MHLAHVASRAHAVRPQSHLPPTLRCVAGDDESGAKRPLALAHAQDARVDGHYDPHPLGSGQRTAQRAAEQRAPAVAHLDGEGRQAVAQRDREAVCCAFATKGGGQEGHVAQREACIVGREGVGGGGGARLVGVAVGGQQ